MTDKPDGKRWGLIGVFAFCFFVGGWIEWRGSSREYMEVGWHWQLIVALLALAAIFSVAVLRVHPLIVTLSIGSAFPAVVIGRVVLDCMQDPTDHNLWPFEVICAFVFGTATAFLAAAIAAASRSIADSFFKSP